MVGGCGRKRVLRREKGGREKSRPYGGRGFAKRDKDAVENGGQDASCPYGGKTLPMDEDVTAGRHIDLRWPTAGVCTTGAVVVV